MRSKRRWSLWHTTQELEQAIDAAGGNGRDAETVPETLRAGLGALDAGIGHDPGDLPVGGRPGLGPEGPAGGGFRRRRAERVDELEGAEQLGRDRSLARTLGAALQGLDPDRGGLRSTSLGQTARASETRAPVWASVSAKVWSVGFEETPAFIGGEVLAAAGVEAQQSCHFFSPSCASTCLRIETVSSLGFQ